MSEDKANSCDKTSQSASSRKTHDLGISGQSNNFPQFIVIHTVKGFGIINKTEVDVFPGTLLLLQ